MAETELLYPPSDRNLMQNFFEKLSREEVEIIFKKNIFEKCQLTVDQEKTKHVINVGLVSAGIEKFGKIYILPTEVYELKDKFCAFSFRIGTRVYFFKSKVHIDGKGFFVEVGFDVLELRRRKHVRFDVPANFEHTCSVITSINKSSRVDAILTNFSESGAKIMASADLVIFQKGNGLILSIKVGKRAAFLVGCQIRFVGRKSKESPELGVEFVNLTDIKHSRILNICEDLSRHMIQQRKSRRY